MTCYNCHYNDICYLLATQGYQEGCGDPSTVINKPEENAEVTERKNPNVYGVNDIVKNLQKELGF